jgi:Cof subfamily protein (haloacid dehalogenase superfamily)
LILLESSVSYPLWEMSNTYADGRSPSNQLQPHPQSKLRHRFRMIAIDMDGTLLSPKGTVTDRTKQAIHRALAKGTLICFATGRNWTESQMVLEAVEHYDTAVFVGGAVVMDTKRQLTLHRKLMEPQLAAELCEFFEKRGHAALALQDTGATGVDYLITDGFTLDPATEMWMQVATKLVHRVPNLGGYAAHSHTVRVGVVAVPEETAKMAVELSEIFGNRIVHHCIAVMSFGVDVLEVFDPAVNKWQGLLHVAAVHGIDPADIIAIGDETNDLPMIRNAGLGVAMGNVRLEVRAAAKRVIGRNDEDGLARFLEELVLEEMVEPLRE